MSIATAIQSIETRLSGTSAHLIAVTKTKPIEDLREAYEAGCRRFGENKVQELIEKQPQLPNDLEWHFIGHLQTNKVKFIAPMVGLIHSVDSFKLAQEINKQAQKNQRTIACLLQLHIAREETKFGLSEEEAEALLHSDELKGLTNIRITGLMGMASNTDDESQVREEFKGLKRFFDRMQAEVQLPNVALSELSMGMSGDWPLAVEEGATLIRVGSAIFGARNYPV